MSTTTKIQGVIFDKDGTILEIAPYCYGVIQKAAEGLVRDYVSGSEALRAQVLDKLLQLAGFVVDTTGEIRLEPECIVIRGTNQDLIEAWIAYLKQVDPHFPEAFCEDARKRLKTGYAHGIVRSNGDLASLFHGLKGRGLRIGVATSDDRLSLEHCLRELGIYDDVDLYYAADDVACPKPHPEIMENFSRQWNIPSSRLMMVGDSENDMRFARNSGAVGVLLDEVRGGTGTAGSGSVAHYRIAALSELPKLIDLLERLSV